MQPVWTLIDAIQQQSEIRAIKLVNELQNMRHDEKETAQMIGTWDGRQECEEEAKKMRADDIKDIRKSLVSFVKNHTCILLRNLYVKIGLEEQKLTQRFNRNPATRTTEIDQKSQTSYLRQSMQLERYWFTTLYSDQGNNVRIVGPVGERPLHVCALSAHRFGNVNFEGTGNYVSEGIVQGMMEYISTSLEQDAGHDLSNGAQDKLSTGWREATAQYGKDYCAAVGSFKKDWDNYGNKYPIPPFFRQINNWKRDHLEQRGYGSTPQRFAKILVTTGLYEGETILFPLIAGKHEDAIRMLLKRDSKPRCPPLLPSSPMPLAHCGPAVWCVCGGAQVSAAACEGALLPAHA